MRLAAHFWTVWPLVRKRLRPLAPPAGEAWSLAFDDPHAGEVRLTGRLTAVDGRRLVVLVHGLGGSIDSTYMIRTARAAEAMGLASLRLNLRGADRSGDDFYHAGLSGDLGRVLQSPALARFAEIFFLGYSLGGHLALRFATEVEDPRLRAVAAVCSPLDLDVSVRHFDRPAGWLYRRYILRGLLEMAERQAERGTMPTPLDKLRRVRTVREWDRHTVVPRFGFESPEDYYRQASVGRRLDRLRRPALLIATPGDPFVHPDAVRSALNGNHRRLRVEWVDGGGHVAFPASLDLGQEGPPGIEGQALGWLVAQGDASP
jgi:predicted alpha/beta-fold hydrolase